ncbi:ANTAR domain-containing protein [Amycolatopsis sp. NPDC051373]|uniref:ANTAR domain-containing response regulator n=1 Tax=Amycolatopsis sp. NPDC051373 TaxID=3155801 RepID=UPI00344E428F
MASLQNQPTAADELADRWSRPEPTPRDYRAAVAEIEQLRAALRSRAPIEQAKGMLMERHSCGPDEAFDALRAISQDTNTKLRDVARTIVEATLEERTTRRPTA